MPRSKPYPNLPRGKKFKTDVATPPHIKAEIYEKFSIDHDPCPLYGKKTGPDGLDRKIPWGKNNYVNPPYNEEMLAFAVRAKEEMEKGNNSYFLIPFRPCTSYYKEILKTCTNILFLRKNFPFVGYKSNYMWPLVIVCFETGKVPYFKKEKGKYLKIFEPCQ